MAMLTRALGDEARARAWWTATAGRVSGSPDIDSAIHELTSSIDRDLHPYAVRVFREDAATNELSLKSSHAKGPLRDHTVSLRPEQGIVGFAYRHRVPMAVHDVAKDPRYLRGPLAEAASAIAVPILSDDRSWGALDVEADRPWAFDGLDIEGFAALAASLGEALARGHAITAAPSR
jgi:signal transduction protein with GAF and PtsI domain